MSSATACPIRRRDPPDGDIVNLDITLEKNGFIADSSKTYLVGNAPPAARRLVRGWPRRRCGKASDRCGRAPIWGISASRSSGTPRRNGYSVVREYCGHGIGREMHEEPQVLNFGKPGKGLKLREGMVFTIEPMVNQGTCGTSTGERRLDGRDQRPEALRPVRAYGRRHGTGVDVLTLRRDEMPMLETGT
jgi:methionyl aminopeptidase